MNWTKTAPIVEGFYWFRGMSPLTDEDEPENIVLVRMGRDGKRLVVPDYGFRSEFDLSTFDGEWSEKLIPPQKD